MNSDMICGDSGREGRGRKELLKLGNPTEEMLGPQGTRLEEDGELWAPGVSIAPGTWIELNKQFLDYKPKDDWLLAILFY